MPTQEEYWEALQSKICAKCLDGDGKGGCMIGPRTDCALRDHMPQILEVVNSVYSSSVEPYEKQLREKVCSVCIHQSPNGECAMRDEVECALDRYFPLIVQVLEETQVRARLNKS